MHACTSATMLEEFVHWGGGGGGGYLISKTVKQFQP